MARIPRNVRNLNPGNLMPPTDAEGYDWWPGYAGSDPGGFAQFKDAKSGINALLQQIRIDKGRKLTLRKFIEKYVGKTADPEGTANALRNIPQILGARLDTLLTEIPSDSLARAITQSEGGAAAADTFKIPSTEEEIDLGVAAEELGVKVATGGSGGRARKQAKQYAERAKLNQEEFNALSPEKKKEISAGQHVTKQRDMRTELTPYQIDAEKRGHFAALLTDPNVRYGKRRSDPSVSTRPQVVPRPETPLPSLKRAGSLAVPDTSTMPLDLQGMEPGAEAGGMQTQAEAGGPSFLSRLGGAIKDNPMIAAQIAQVVGGIGSGVLGGRRMAKEQAKGARRQREAMNMANAISTLTRGRTQPAVAPRPVISKPGGAETIFDILGTLGKGGAQITQGIQQREEAAEDRRRQQEMEDFRKEYLTRGQDIEQSEVDRKRQADLDGGEGGGEADYTFISKDQAKLLRDKLNDLKEMHAKGDFLTTGILSLEDRRFGEGATEQKVFNNTARMLIGPMKNVMSLGRLTKEDLALVMETLPKSGDTSRVVDGKIAGILSIADWVEEQDRLGVSLSQSRPEAYERIMQMGRQYSGGATGTGAPTGTGGDYADMSEDDLQRLYDEDPNNEEVVAEMKRRI